MKVIVVYDVEAKTRSSPTSKRPTEPAISTLKQAASSRLFRSRTIRSRQPPSSLSTCPAALTSSMPPPRPIRHQMKQAADDAAMGDANRRPIAPFQAIRQTGAPACHSFRRLHPEEGNSTCPGVALPEVPGCTIEISGKGEPLPVAKMHFLEPVIDEGTRRGQTHAGADALHGLARALERAGNEIECRRIRHQALSASAPLASACSLPVSLRSVSILALNTPFGVPVCFAMAAKPDQRQP